MFLRSCFWVSTLSVRFVGQSMLSTVAIHAARNSRLMGGRSFCFVARAISAVSIGLVYGKFFG